MQPIKERIILIDEVMLDEFTYFQEGDELIVEKKDIKGKPQYRFYLNDTEYFNIPPSKFKIITEEVKNEYESLYDGFVNYFESELFGFDAEEGFFPIIELTYEEGSASPKIELFSCELLDEEEGIFKAGNIDNYRVEDVLLDLDRVYYDSDRIFNRDMFGKVHGSISEDGKRVWKVCGFDKSGNKLYKWLLEQIITVHNIQPSEYSASDIKFATEALKSKAAYVPDKLT